VTSDSMYDDLNDVNDDQFDAGDILLSSDSEDDDDDDDDVGEERKHEERKNDDDEDIDASSMDSSNNRAPAASTNTVSRSKSPTTGKTTGTSSKSSELSNKLKRRPPNKVDCSKKRKMSISPQRDNKQDGGIERWKEILGQAKIDEAKARTASANASAAAASAAADTALLEREKWDFQKQQMMMQHTTQSSDMMIKLERMKKYTEMKNLGFNDEVIGDMVEELKPLIDSIRRNKS
jgi:hypothetical protein